MRRSEEISARLKDSGNQSRGSLLIDLAFLLDRVRRLEAVADAAKALLQSAKDVDGGALIGECELEQALAALDEEQG